MGGCMSKSPTKEGGPGKAVQFDSMKNQQQAPQETAKAKSHEMAEATKEPVPQEMIDEIKKEAVPESKGSPLSSPPPPAAHEGEGQEPTRTASTRSDDPVQTSELAKGMQAAAATTPPAAGVPAKLSPPEMKKESPSNKSWHDMIDTVASRSAELQKQESSRIEGLKQRFEK